MPKHPEEKPEMTYGHLPGEKQTPEPCWFSGCNETQDDSGCPTHGIS